MAGEAESQLEKKINLKKGMKTRVVGRPAGVDIEGVATTSPSAAESALVFARTLADVEKSAAPVVAAAREDRIACLAYPKAGQLDTDLNRDILWRHMLKKGVSGVRQVAIDDVWSAMRFRHKGG